MTLKKYFTRRKKQKAINRNIYISKDKKRKIIMKSSWEILAAQWFDSKNIKWEYEIIGAKTGIGIYWPDFWLDNGYIITGKNGPIVVEIKGRLFPKAKIKIEQFRLLYPNMTLIVLFKEDLKKLGIL